MLKRKLHTGFLFATPSFLMGAGTVMNLAGSYYKFNDSENDAEADFKAIENDFAIIGSDISHSIELFEKQYNTTIEK
jgi:hypothetical protein